MNLPAVLDPVPLVPAEGGRVVRVAGTRVPLDTLVEAFKTGATPEEIVQDYSALSLPDVYAVLAYYLQHQAEVEEYLVQRAKLADEAETRVAADFDYPSFRERLLRRTERAKVGSV